ncbi:MAG: hypothetical protein ACOH2M_03630 [Cypionkella sp.]
MTKHLADHRALPQGDRSKHFLAIERQPSSAQWDEARQQPRLRSDAALRLVEYLRIERGDLK